MRTPALGGGRCQLAGRAGNDDTRDTRHSDVPAQLRRRRAAAHRCPPLPGGRRDPWHYPATEPVTDRELASWRLAWRHLHGLDLPAAVPERVVAAGRARGGDGAS